LPYLTTQRNFQWHYTLSGAGEPLLFVHGWGADLRLWAQQALYFSKRYRVMTIDLPGHGKTHWKPLPFDRMVRNLKDATERLGLNGMNVVGSSLGGLVALKLFDLFPEGVKRMVWVGCLPKFLHSPDYPFGLKLEWMRRLAGQLDTDYPLIVHIFFRSLFTPEERESPLFQWFKKFRKNEDLPQREALRGFLDILQKEDLRGVFSKIRIPFQIINGTEDYICSKDAVNFLKRRLPAARVHLFQDCGHFPFLTKPREFNRVLERFLRET